MLNKNKSFDTIVVPAQENNFKRMILEKNVWYPIGIAKSMYAQLEYIAIYMGAPISAIVHIGEIDNIIDFVILDKTGKKIAPFPGKKLIKLKPGSLRSLDRIVPLIDKERPIQSPRYSQYEKILSAKSIDELFLKDNE